MADNKKRVMILLDIDPDTFGDSSANSTTRLPGMFLVEVRRDKLAPDAPLIGAAAHELGHVLAKVFETPAETADPRKNGSAGKLMHMLGPTGDQRKRMVVAEREAWDLAEQMVGKENLPTRDVDLATYEDA